MEGGIPGRGAVRPTARGDKQGCRRPPLTKMLRMLALKGAAAFVLPWEERPWQGVTGAGPCFRGELQSSVEHSAHSDEAREMSFERCGGELGEYFKRTLAFFVGVCAVPGGVLQLPLHVVPAPGFQLQ